jgi:hypothetical protein
MKTALRTLDHFSLAVNNQTVCGCNQDWYPTIWQRKAGCGPTTASNLLIYHLRAGHLPMTRPLRSKEDGLYLMETVWRHVTPTAMGVHTPEHFEKGLQSFLGANNLSAQTRSLPVHHRPSQRPPFAAVVAFIRSGLALDGPVAFLNLHNGTVHQLDPWHWVTITAINERNEAAVEIEICDNLNRFTMDLREWYETTSRGGGFVYLVV